MSALRLFGSELSPYSVKVRSYLRHREIPHRWLARGGDHEEEFQRLDELLERFGCGILVSGAKR